MPTKQELREQWALWLDGALHASLDALIFGGAGALGWLSGQISFKEAMLILGSAVLAGLRGYYKQSPLPRIIATERSVAPDGTITTTTTSTPVPPNTVVVPEGTTVLPPPPEAGYLTVLALVVLLAVCAAICTAAGVLPVLWLAIILAVLALLAAVLGPNRRVG